MSSQMISRLRSFEAFANAPSVEIRRNSLHPSHGRLLFPHNIVANSNSASQVVSLLANVPSDTMQRSTDEEAQMTHIPDPHTPARWRSDGVARRPAGECVSTRIQSSNVCCTGTRQGAIEMYAYQYGVVLSLGGCRRTRV